MPLVESFLLVRPVELAPAFGDPEPSFIGGGRVGGGSQPDGNFDHLIGPTYSSPNFLHEERLALGWFGGRNRSIAPSMFRVRGSGLLVGTQRIGDLECELWECAPWDDQTLIRVLVVANRGRKPVRQAQVQATVRSPAVAETAGSVLQLTLPVGSASYGGECPSWAERRARIAWNKPASISVDYRDNQGKIQVLTCDLGDLAPGGQSVLALIHRLDEGDSLPAMPDIADPAALITRELEGWQGWFAQGRPEVRENALIESQLAFIRMQQSYDGGLIAGVRRYAYSYIRDMHGAARGFLAAGFLDEVARELAWIDRKIRRFGTVVNASEMGADVRDFFGGHKGTELPAYVILMAVGYVRAGGSPAVVEACRDSLILAAREQIEASRADGWRFHYNGDETERYVPVVDGSNYLFNKPDWDPKRAEWSMPSHVLAMASLTEFAQVLAPLLQRDPAPYLEAVEHLRTSFRTTFQPDGLTVPLWTVFNDGTRPNYPVPNYLLFPAWVAAPFPAAEIRTWVESAASCLDTDRCHVPVCPGVVAGTCGHGLALLLYGLKKINAPAQRIAELEKLIRTGGQLQWFGLVNEFYGPNGTPNQHNLRPFETGPLTEALLYKPQQGAPA